MSDDKGYAWEGAFECSWAGIEEDETGALMLDQVFEKRAQHKRLEVARCVRKGLIRYLYVIVDLSKQMGNKDWKPHRCDAVSQGLQGFVLQYFDQNPLSNLGLIGIKSSLSEKISDLSGNPKNHIEKLKRSLTVSGEPSLQNALEMAKNSLKTVPSYGSKEILVVYGSLTTADPGDIFVTIESLKRESIRCSFIGIGAEMYLLRKIAEETHGVYHIASDPKHLKQLLTEFTIPAPSIQASVSKYSTLVKMGFPARVNSILSLCVCHQRFTTGGYLCPRCMSKSCELPTTCKVCSLPLVSSPHLARSYHHLFPIENFVHVKEESNDANKVFSGGDKCFGCLAEVEVSLKFKCPKCENHFCDSCDMYIHDSLHNCPGCE